MTARSTIARRLTAAGYVWAGGWLPPAHARIVNEQVAMHTKDVERIAAQPKPKGRPKWRKIA